MARLLPPGSSQAFTRSEYARRSGRRLVDNSSVGILRVSSFPPGQLDDLPMRSLARRRGRGWEEWLCVSLHPPVQLNALKEI